MQVSASIKINNKCYVPKNKVYRVIRYECKQNIAQDTTQNYLQMMTTLKEKFDARILRCSNTNCVFGNKQQNKCMSVMNNVTAK